MTKLPTFFISHGGGPWPYIPEMKQAFAKTAAELAALPRLLPETPRAIVVISGHWEESSFTVSTAAHPGMVYDYSGFPEHTYRVVYPAPGAPEVAARVHDLISRAELPAGLSADRGFDHGTFVPLALMYPRAEIPIVSLSMKKDYDPEEHLRLGRALAPLRDEGVLLIGSGLSYHNMRGFRTGMGLEASQTFEQWLHQTIEDPAQREQRLINWEQAPLAREAHPHEDHLLPLMVVAGAATPGAAGKRLFLDHVMNVVMASYQFD